MSPGGLPPYGLFNQLALLGICLIPALEHSPLKPARSRAPSVPLYPPIDAYVTERLEVGSGHTLYVEQSGNPSGVPVVFVHGGPGAGTAAAYRRFFDPDHYRIILFDQRGSGQSTPLAGLRDNTTTHLISDLETLREHLGVERWLVFGGSWGSTLALAYGQAHPQRCIGFVLRGIFLFRPPEVQWFLTGMARFFPEAARSFRAHIPEDERDDLLKAYYTRLTSEDPLVHRPAAAAWCAYENACSRLVPASGKAADDGFYPGALAMARIEAHYMVNHGFMSPDQLMRGMPAIAQHPAVIVQGRYDIVCPIATADDLAQAWPNAAYRVVPDAGHSSMEPGVRSALVTATNEFRDLR